MVNEAPSSLTCRRWPRRTPRRCGRSRRTWAPTSPPCSGRPFIEDEAPAGWPTLQPSTGTPDDLKAYGVLRTVMGERREQRVDPKLREVRSRLASVVEVVPNLILRAAAGRVN